MKSVGSNLQLVALEKQNELPRNVTGILWTIFPYLSEATWVEPGSFSSNNQGTLVRSESDLPLSRHTTERHQNGLRAIPVFWQGTGLLKADST